MVELPRHGSPEEGRQRLLRAARKRYLRGQRIELAQLAAEQGIGRATAYRWLGDNDRLLAEILAGRVEDAVAALQRAHATAAGPEKVLGVAEGLLRRAAASKHLDALLRRDHRRVLKILTTDVHRVHPTAIGLFEQLLNHESKAGRLLLTTNAHTLAYGIVHLIEAYVCTTAVTGHKPDLGTTVQLFGLLLPN